MVETGESRTPRPKDPLAEYTTSLSGAFFSPPRASTGRISQRLADNSLAASIGVLATASRTYGACIPASGNNGEQT